MTLKFQADCQEKLKCYAQMNLDILCFLPDLLKLFLQRNVQERPQRPDIQEGK